MGDPQLLLQAVLSRQAKSSSQSSVEARPTPPEDLGVQPPVQPSPVWPTSQKGGGSHWSGGLGRQ